jgi:hypothetical protein
MYEKTGDNSKIVHFRTCIILTLMQGLLVYNSGGLYLLFNTSGQIPKSFYYIFVFIAILLIFNIKIFSKRKEKIFERLDKNDTSRNKLIKTIVIGSFIFLIIIMLIIGDLLRVRNGF